jgi:uncharacterized protein
MADQSWRARPSVMTARVWIATAQRIAEHVRTHRLSHISIILHGGEPLLAGMPTLTAIAAAVRSKLPSTVECRIGIQTNGVLLSETNLCSLLEHDIRVAVSADGRGPDHDAHRRYRDGRGSSAVVWRALNLLRSDRFRRIYGGLLCTIDPKVDPVSCYYALLQFEPPAVDVLLPHANWETGINPGYGDWLVRMFDVYFNQPVKQTAVRFFDEIVNLHLGGRSRSEHAGLSPAAVAVIESDGAIEQTDALKSTYPGAATTGLSVLTDPFDAALHHPGVVARQLGVDALCATCQNCAVRDICGGGHYVHRYRMDTGFLNPSAYCADMKIIISHIGRQIANSLGQRWERRPESTPLSDDQRHKFRASHMSRSFQGRAPRAREATTDVDQQ